MSMISPYSIFCITCAEVDVMFDSKISSKTKELRMSAIKSLPGYLHRYADDNMLPKLIDAVCEKKLEFIMQANTLGEIQEIMRPALPEKTYSGIVCRSPYHIPEEELMIWAHISPYCKLIPEASGRCLMLFEQIYGCSVYDYEGEMQNDR